MLALAVVVVSRVVIAEPLSAIAHFGHCPHVGGECQKIIFSVKSKKTGLEQRRNTSNAKSVESDPGQASSVGRIASLLQNCFSRRSKINRDVSLFLSFDLRPV